MFSAAALMLAACGPKGAPPMLAGDCPVGLRAAQWEFRRTAVRPDLIYRGSNFFAPAKNWGLKVDSSANPNAADVFVSLESCKPRKALEDWTPCHEVKESVGFPDVAARRGHMELTAFHAFRSTDRRYYGLCDNLDLLKAKPTDPYAFCRIWLADVAKARGLYIVIPWEAFPKVEEIVADAEVLLDDKYAGCAVV